jgi:hypothetical protein
MSERTERQALIDEVIAYYDQIVAKAPIDDAEWDFVMTAAEYRIITGAYSKQRALTALRDADKAQQQAEPHIHTIACAAKGCAISSWQWDLRSTEQQAEAQDADADASKQEQCYYCKQWYPKPVEYHHTEAECAEAQGVPAAHKDVTDDELAAEIKRVHDLMMPTAPKEQE